MIKKVMQYGIFLSDCTPTNKLSFALNMILQNHPME